MANNPESEWKAYCAEELGRLTPILTELGFELEDEQPHLDGERYLMQAVTTVSGRKLILLGHRASDGLRVIIKATRDAAGMEELAHERLCRRVLRKIPFAYEGFLAPEEVLFIWKGPYVIAAQTFIEQEQPFLSRPIEEQFSLALNSFKAQEGAHATTYEHAKLIKKTFGAREPHDYLDCYAAFKREIVSRYADDSRIADALREGEEFLASHVETIDRYGGFLTHTDFVPHNFRVVGSSIYLLDHSSLRFGNKYEGWARFVNFMALYHPRLERACIEYVSQNRSEEESLALRLMRVYRLGEIMAYYVRTLSKSEGDLYQLNEARVKFWASVLAAVLADTSVEERVRTDYISLRDSLRSEGERRRQRDLH